MHTSCHHLLACTHNANMHHSVKKFLACTKRARFVGYARIMPKVFERSFSYPLYIAPPARSYMQDSCQINCLARVSWCCGSQRRPLAYASMPQTSLYISPQKPHNSPLTPLGSLPHTNLPITLREPVQARFRVHAQFMPKSFDAIFMPGQKIGGSRTFWQLFRSLTAEAASLWIS